MKRMTLLLPLIISVLSTTLICSLASTFRALAQLKDIGAPITVSQSLNTAFYDLQHFAPLYGLFIFIAFIVAFITAALTHKFTRQNKVVIYTLAGFISIWVMLWAMKQVFFGVPIVAGARDNFGLMLQLLSGAFGGWLFIKLRTKKEPET